ncbi:MAG: hypothetical protein B7Z29_09560 [Hyphomicrobium sp. 12-62-95]|nr:MAG: hypothetical protein B7Z29_09560 [Hyphomicrobium sp. 12-62-95]
MEEPPKPVKVGEALLLSAVRGGRRLNLVPWFWMGGGTHGTWDLSSETFVYGGLIEINSF